MSVNSRYVNGALVFYQAQTWLDALGLTVAKFIENFINTPFASADTLAAWTTTLVEAGGGETTVALTAGATGGALLITTDAAENDGANLQVQGEAFKLASGKPLYFGCEFQLDEATQNDFLIGLAITDTDALGGLTDGIYFRKADASTTMAFVLEKDSTETSTNYGTAIAASTTYKVEFYFSGTTVNWWVNGVKQTAPATTNLPDDEFLTPTIHYLTGEAVAHTMTVNWLRCFQVN